MKTPALLFRSAGFILALVAGPSLALAQPGAVDINFNAAASAGHWAYSLAVQPDGRVLAAGTFGVMRFQSDGSVDPSFQPVLPGPMSSAYAGARLGAVRWQADGRILVTGSFTNPAGGLLPALLRLQSNGVVDASFTLDARVYPAGRRLVVQPDGKVITTGHFAGAGDTEYSGLVRLRADGSFDESFKAQWFNDSADIYSLSQSPEGKIYFGTLTQVLRANADGSQDGAFEPGMSLGPFGAVAEQWDGRVLVGHYGDGPRHRSLERVFHNSLTDEDWMVPSISGGDHVIYSIVVQPNGKVLFGGNTIYGVNGVPVSGLARLHRDGLLDTNFNTYSSSHFFSVEDMALAPDGGVLVAGLLQQGTEVRGVWRLHNDAGPGGIEFAAANYTAREGDDRVNIRVRRTTGTNVAAVVAYAARPGSATRGKDYFGGDGLLFFRPGETVKHFRIYVVPDRRSENFETVRLSLLHARGGRIGPQHQAVLTILDR